MKRKLALLLALLLGLTACGEDRAEKTVYLPEEAAFTTGLDWVRDACLSGDFLYLLGTVRERVGQAGSRGRWTLYRVPIEGGAGEELPFESPFSGGNADDCYSPSLRSGRDGSVWVLDDTFYDNSDPVYLFRRLDRTGRELERFDFRKSEKPFLEQFGRSVWSLSDVAANADGSLFARGGNQAAMLDNEGNALYTLTLDRLEEEFPAYSDGFIALGGGGLGLLAKRKEEEGEDRLWLQTIDMEARDWGEAFLLPQRIRKVWPGDGDALFYCQDETSLYVWREGEAEPERILDWMDSRLDGDLVQDLAVLPDGRIAVVSERRYDGGNGTVLHLLSPADAAGLKPRKELVFGTISLSGEDRARINRFNSESGEYHITVEDYAVYQSDTGYIDWNASRTRMATMISAGAIPDILDMDGLPLRRFGSRGFLEDLWPWIDGDPELGREKLMTRPLEEASQDGRLYILGEAFGIHTLVGPADMVGDRMGWSYEDFLAVREAMPPEFVMLETGGADRTGMLQSLLWEEEDVFLDWEAGICRFDSEEFRELLEFCCQLPEEDSWRSDAGMLEGNAVAMRAHVFSFDGMFDGAAMYKGMCGGDMAYIGYPTASGRPGASFRLSQKLAMTTACREKEGAWSFLRTLLLPEEHTVNYESLTDKAVFYINKAAFRNMTEQAMTPAYAVDEEGNYRLSQDGGRIEKPKRSFSINHVRNPCEIYAVTEEDYEQWMALYEAASGLNDFDSALADIITETAGACFAGDKTLDETVELIQNRASLYISEQS